MDWVTEDLNRLEREEAKYRESLPECECCGEPIQSDYTYIILGDYYCEECAEEWLKACSVPTERLVDEG